MQKQFQPVAPTLEDEFSALSSECIVASEAYIKAEDTITKKLARLYLLWRRLRTDQVLMTKIHQQEGLTAPNYSVPEPEFDIFAKIAFRYGLTRTVEDRQRNAASNSRTRRNKQTKYVAALLRLHLEYEANPRRYQTEDEARLVVFLESGGRITGAYDWRRDRNRALALAKSTKVASPSITAPASSAATANAATRQAFIKSTIPLVARSIITNGSGRVAAGDLTFDANGRAVVVYERDRAGLRWYEVANENIDPLALKPAGHIKYVEQPFLRALGEVVRTQLYPKQFAPAGVRVDLGSDFRVWERKVFGAKARRHLLMSPSKIVLSATRPTANLVTELEPRDRLLSDGQALLRSGERDLYQIEDILDAAALPACLINPERPRALNSGAAGVLLRCSRGSNQADIVRAVLLKFDDATDIGKRNPQPSLNLAAFKPIWRFSAEASWFSALRRDFIENWLANPGAPNRITRLENRLFRVSVSRNAFAIGYKVDATGTFPTHIQPLGGSNSTQAKLAVGQSTTLDIASFDFVRAFGAFPDVQVRKRVTVAGDDHLLLMTFNTDMGAFKVGMPAVSRSAKGLDADATHMTGV